MFSRSDVLRPLLWLTVVVAVVDVLSAYAKAPQWLLIAHYALLAFCVLFYAGSFVYCLLKDPVSLMSESSQATQLQKVSGAASATSDQSPPFR